MKASITYNKENPNFYYNISFGDSPEGKQTLVDLKAFFSVFDQSVSYSYNYKNGLDDGMVHYVTTKNNRFLIGLKSRILKWCKGKGIEVDDATYTEPTSIDKSDLSKWMHNIGFKHDPYFFQVDMVYQALTNKRTTILAAVGSGKSYSIYALTRWCQANDMSCVVLTPDLMLKSQLHSDFKDYYDSYHTELTKELSTSHREEDIKAIEKKIKAIEKARTRDNCNNFDDVWELVEDDESKFSDKPIKIVNWQSVFRLADTDYFQNIDMIIIDEVHKAGSADSYYAILEALTDCKYRIGFTGTKPPSTLISLNMDGLIGATKRIITLRQLIDLGLATDVFVQPIILKWDQNIIDDVWDVYKEGKPVKMTYAQEQAFFRMHEPRNQFIAKLAMKLSSRGGGQATMILAKNRDQQKILLEIMKEAGANVHAINGSIKAKDREAIRKMASEGGDINIIGGHQILSTGINIPALTNIINTGGKAEVELIQSIGRVTRKTDGKSSAHMYDIVDDARWFGPRGGVKNNYAWKHYINRVEAYIKYELTVEEEKIKEMRC